MYEDRDIIVINKPRGVSSQEDGAMRLVREYLEKKGEDASLFCVHRLDTPTSGAMVYARHEKSAAALSKAITDGEFEKEYLAVAAGTPEEKSGRFDDELFFDRRKNKNFVQSRARGGTKHAALLYEVCDSKNDLSLVRVKLLTGRTHQIRVQFASRKMPLFGDGKYGSHHKGNLALHSASLDFVHPTKHTNVHISCPPPHSETPWALFELSADLAE